MNEYKKEDIRNIHYNNKNEIQYEYGEQVHHYRIENLKEVFINCWNLQQENKQLKDNWNELKEYCLNEQIPEEYDEYNSYIEFSNSVYDNILNKMKELEQGSDSNE